MNKKLIRTTLALLGMSVILNFGSAKAEDNDIAGVIISPPINEKQADRGATYTDSIKVTNPNATADLNISVDIEDFSAKGEEGQQNFIDPIENNSTYSLGKWVTVSEKSFTLKANESKMIDYTVKVPENAEPGGHYGVVFFSPSLVAEPGSESNAVLAIPKVGSLILFTVPGDIKYDGKITSFEAGKKNGESFDAKKLFINSNNTVDYLTKFQNLSSSHVKPQGNIVIKNMFGKVVATLTVNEKLGNILPESVRKFENQWQINHGFGMYTATVALTYGSSKVADASYSFWIVPWKETAGGVVLLIVIIWILTHISWKKNGNSSENSAAPYNNIIQQ